MTAPPGSFLWHDYETFGIDASRDRIVQFAGRRTTAELEPIGEPLMIYCKPDPDLLPQPVSCLITGITPQLARREGLPEPQFIKLIHEQLAKPGTCGAGYNSIRFDDEFTRYALYRNFYDPYEREWRGGNSRWDLIDCVRLCHALRPEGIVWPRREDGSPSFRLEDLSAANGLTHEHAHDALSDVDATIGLARLLFQAQPRLFAHALKLRDKRFAATQIDLHRMQPVLHVSSKIPSKRHCIAVVAPIAQHARNANEVIVYDLCADPSELLDLPVEELRERIFTPMKDLPEGVQRIPLKGVHMNKSPMLAPLEVLKDGDAERLGLDLALAQKNRDTLHAARAQITAKVREVFTTPAREQGDAEQSLYAGFLPEADRLRCAKVRDAAPEQLAAIQGQFQDARYNELLFRYRARHYPQTLNEAERAQWADHLDRKLNYDGGLASINLPQYRELVAQMKAQEHDPAKLEILAALERWPAEAGLAG